MKLYFAPLDGITGFIYRNAFDEMFGGVDKYFAPFITPGQNPRMKGKEIRDILPENNNPNINLIPQLMGNNAEYFVKGAKQVADMGYDEININAGCPSGTVVPKGRGAGLLKDIDAMDEFLYEIFSNLDMKISMKTRIGIEDSSEFEEIMNVYNKYPFEEVIVHPRTRVQMYKGEPDMEAFDYAYKTSTNKLSYNGNVYTADDYKQITKKYDIDSVMLGRGILRNPNLANEIRGEKALTMEQLKAFHQRLYDDFTREMQSDRHLLNKMIEMWNYWSYMFENQHKIAKMIRKASTVPKYESAVEEIFTKY